MVEWRLRADPAERLRRPPERAPRRRSGGSIILRGAIKALVLLLLWTAIIGGGVLGYFALTLPDTRRADPGRAAPERHGPRR